MITYTRHLSGYLSGNGYITIPQSHSLYFRALKEVESGEAEIIPYTQELEDLRREKIIGVRAEAIRRIGLAVNVIPEIDMTDYAIGCYQHAWPVANASIKLVDGKAAYDYAKTKLNQARGATREQLEAYDPSTDNNWP